MVRLFFIGNSDKRSGWRARFWRGIVTYAGWAEGYGKTIIIEHDGGYSTLYGHNSELLVSRGTSTRQGQIIARTGDTGITTGPVLHFEIRERGKSVNPLLFLGL